MANVAKRNEAILITSSQHDYIVMKKQFFIYIMTNPHNRVLYTGVTGEETGMRWI